jgi:hypothetical protein
MINAARDMDQEPSQELLGWDAQPEVRADLNRDVIDLTQRFFVGLLSLGSEEFTRRLTEMQRRLDEDPSLWGAMMPAREKTLRRRAWHLGVGLTKRGQRRVRSGLRRSYKLTLRAAGRVASTTGRMGANRLARPMRRPIEARLRRWHQAAVQVEREGELEEQKGKALASGALTTLILEIMDEIAKNPDMQMFVQELIGQQGVGMATGIVDNARSATLTADDGAEAVLRWMLRRTPRRELPPSPVEGQPQTMYEPTARVEGGTSDVQ